MGYAIMKRYGGSENKLPAILYTGKSTGIVDEGSGNWYIILESTDMKIGGEYSVTFTSLGNAKRGIDICVMGGGGSGATGWDETTSNNAGHGGGGGGAGYVTNDVTGTIVPEKGIPYSVIIGSGGAGVTNYGYNGNSGEQSSITFETPISANGGGGGTIIKNRTDFSRSDGGSGSANGGAGGVRSAFGQTIEDAFDGEDGVYAFGDAAFNIKLGGGGGGGLAHGQSSVGSNLWAEGGLGGSPYGGDGGTIGSQSGKDGTRFGAGGGGTRYTSGGGASGVVLIRNHRS